MNVVVVIDGREAIPVRAIPFVTGWTLSPDALVNDLAGSSELTRIHDPRAYHLTERGPYPAMLPKEWDAVVADILELQERLYGDDNPKGRYLAWRERSIYRLPKAVFLWRDEFELSFEIGYGRHRWAIMRERAGDRGITLTPIIPDNVCDAIMEGFERFAALAPPADLPQDESLAAKDDKDMAARRDDPPTPNETKPEPANAGVTVTLPHMTAKLEALLKIMRANWTDYDPKRLPKQVNIAAEIDEAMGWTPEKNGTPLAMAGRLPPSSSQTGLPTIRPRDRDPRHGPYAPFLGSPPT